MRRTQVDVVVSAENTPYLAWQSLVFHYACVSAGDRPPLIVVHGDEPELIEPYKRLAHFGGRVTRAPNYRNTGGVDYPPRNSAGTLLHAETEGDAVLLCDADMLPLRPVADQDLGSAGSSVGFDRVSYLVVTDDAHARLTTVCDRLGLPLAAIEGPVRWGGVPHLVPTDVRVELAREWLNCIAAFPQETRPDGALHLPWGSLASMWGLALAVSRLGLQSHCAELCETNADGKRPWAEVCQSGRSWLHYCYGDEGFDKRAYRGFWSDPTLEEFQPRPGSVHAHLVAIVRNAARYFGYVT